MKTSRYGGKRGVNWDPLDWMGMESSITIKKIQSTSSNLHINSHSMFQSENKNCIDLEVIVLLLAEACDSF